MVAFNQTPRNKKKIELSEDGTKYQYVGSKRRYRRFQPRVYAEEKRSFEDESERYLAEHYTEMVHVDGVSTSPIHTIWKKNNHISLKELTDLFEKVNEETQHSPC